MATWKHNHPYTAKLVALAAVQACSLGRHTQAMASGHKQFVSRCCFVSLFYVIGSYDAAVFPSHAVAEGLQASYLYGTEGNLILSMGASAHSLLPEDLPTVSIRTDLSTWPSER